MKFERPSENFVALVLLAVLEMVVKAFTYPGREAHQRCLLTQPRWLIEYPTFGHVQTRATWVVTKVRLRSANRIALIRFSFPYTNMKFVNNSGVYFLPVD